jgi:membrane protease YdiL (CAAX protease family)
MADDTSQSSIDTTMPPPLEARPGRQTRRLMALVEVIAASGFPSQLGLSLLLIGLGVQPIDERGGLALRYVAMVWVLDVVVLLGFISWRLRATGESLRTLLLGTKAVRRELLLGLALVPLLLAVVTVVLGGIRLAVPALHNVATNPFEGLVRSALDAWTLGAMAVLSGGIKEEAQRAFVLHRFEEHLGGAWVGLVPFSVVFGLGHFIQGWDIGVVTTLLGLFWGVLYLQRRSATASVVSHSGFNVVQILQFTLFGAS